MQPRTTEKTLAALRSRFGDFLSFDPVDLAEYGRDWTRVYSPAPCAVALPRDAGEVATLMAFCNENALPVVPSGGRTGLAGGAMACNGEVVLSLSRLRKIDPVDLDGMTVRAEAGVVTEALHRHCEPYGLTWPVDFASKGSSLIGGNISTNAGGVRVIRYGTTRAWVLGLEVVLANGETLELNGALEKNNTGLDLRQLFIGTEGTLGVITAATLKLTRIPERHDVLLLAVRDLAAVLTLFRAVRETHFTLSAFEFFTAQCMARVERHRGLRVPFESPSMCYVLVELEDAHRDALETWAAGLFDSGLVTDGTLARDSSQATALWALRESISESLSATGLPHKNDVALPIAHVGAFCARLDEVFSTRYPGWEIALFGHIGDGNLHINVMKPDAMSREEFFARTHEADHAIFTVVREFSGSISAEHGIGLLKRDCLGYSRSAEELSLMRATKRALDPKNILNPGKIFE